MSHHLDSPLARKDPRLNITDHYVFDSGSSTVLIMNIRTSLAADDVAQYGPVIADLVASVVRRRGTVDRPEIYTA